MAKGKGTKSHTKINKTYTYSLNIDPTKDRVNNPSAQKGQVVPTYYNTPTED